MSNKDKLTKEDFITRLTKMTRDEIIQYIKDNGKKPKLIQLYRRVPQGKK